jgi:hypothetical protein
MVHEIPRCARNDRSFLGAGREKRRFFKNTISQINYRSNRRFSLSANILACHSERSEESHGLKRTLFIAVFQRIMYSG